MKALVTGLNGTVGTALGSHLRGDGWTVSGWDRAAVPIDHYQKMEDFVRAEAPDVLFHLAIASKSTGRNNESWLVNYEWTSELAWICRMLGVTYVFASTAMVFSNDAKGPFTRESKPDAPEGYGYEKRRAEERVQHQNVDARIVRLGWQIGSSPGTNNMIDYFDRNMREHGHVDCSRKWYPACSFLEDTASCLAALASMPRGLYHLDSNTGWTFHEIACELNRLHGSKWNIHANDDFVYDQRLQDDRLKVPSLDKRLQGLRKL